MNPMPTDLSPCQPIFDRDPVRYLDMTEPVRRGEGKVLAASPAGALVYVPTDHPADAIYALSAAGAKGAERLCSLIPPDAAYVTVHEPWALPAVQARCGYQTMNPVWQVGYLSQTPLPMPDALFQVRPLDLSRLDAVRAHYDKLETDYLVRRLISGQLFGAFLGETLAGFAGFHAEGTIGLLEVFPAYRRRGVGGLLQAYLTNLELERGNTPYGQVFDGNTPSLALQRGLGFQISKEPLYWPDF